MALLKVSEIQASYGASQALFGVNLDVGDGEVVALMGRNGMGKSTTIKVICRLLKNSSGTVEFSDKDIGKLPAHRVARMGIGLCPEGRRCFSNLTVYENLIAASRSGEWTFERIVELFPRLGERRNQYANSLSGGEQQMLAISRALMTNPQLLILDEATEGLAPVVRQEIWAAISKLKKETGLSILVVDKTIAELANVADRAVILERGKTVWTGNFTALTPEISEQYLGI
ncbi:ABC transporter ATP-binding protein [Ahrensia marina]|uniref:ABC transporter ATP-binding protein n=1 Tax=Ahrensia marina TaxID=1514904 RepID=A0A0M9GND1_9HYPH|nr:ABC transporter ATP-binding protein [Ahrensia marina]KPB01850.1 ABC transporter ATP-binding protein [Ahrensia marina]